MQILSRLADELPRCAAVKTILCVLTLHGVTRTTSRADPPSSSQPTVVRIATYNVSLYGEQSGQVAQRLADGEDEQAEKLARVIQTVRPDVLLLNEMDYDVDGRAVNSFAEKFLAQPQGDWEPIDFPYRYWAASNTGMDSGLDIDGDGRTGQLSDNWGFGLYQGQYAMAVISRFPIDTENLRSFQTFKWNQLPGALQPIDPRSGEPFYNEEIWKQLRLSSKNHIDVPVRIHGHTIHLLASHPTPPVFDGKEDRNGCRNHDEIRFWSLYLSPDQSAKFRDDQGRLGGLSEDQSFVIAGDLNSDPARGDSRREAIVHLLQHPRTNDPLPSRTKESLQHQTASFGGKRQYRLDYVLPSKDLQLIDSGVHWPVRSNANASINEQETTDGIEAIEATDHRLVWIEVALP